VFLLALFSRRTTSYSVFPATLLSACVTMFLIYSCDNWFSVWFWPIGFALTFVLVVPLNVALRQRSNCAEPALTFRHVMKTHPVKTKPGA